jgi:hypothetical protein
VTPRPHASHGDSVRSGGGAALTSKRLRKHSKSWCVAADAAIAAKRRWRSPLSPALQAMQRSASPEASVRRAAKSRAGEGRSGEGWAGAAEAGDAGRSGRAGPGGKRLGWGGWCGSGQGRAGLEGRGGERWGGPWKLARVDVGL